MVKSFIFNEKYLSHIPALQLLINSGFAYLTPEQVRTERGGKLSAVLLENVLREQLKTSNRIKHKGQTYLFSEENIQSAIERLKSVKYEGLLKTNEAIYDLLTLGVSLEQSVEGDLKSFTLNYVDWNTPANNKFHVAAEFPVERTRIRETTRPDIILFVNGIPFAVIECKSPNQELAAAVSRMLRNQREKYVPRLFAYVQLVVGVNKNAAQYATVGTPQKLWSVWKEDIPEGDLRSILDKPLAARDKAGLDKLLTQDAGIHVDSARYYAGKTPTLQDGTLYALCRPERLLELARLYTVFDAGVRKIARSRQYFAIKKILHRVKQRDPEGRREGGIIWHAQGSGKSLAMVMLARALAMDQEIRNPRIVLVTDRIDLDKQLGDTFRTCGLSPDHAASTRQLLKLAADDQAHIITTLMHTFDRALTIRSFQEDSANIFVLVDESHRAIFGNIAARTRRMFPMACYLGFTGTPPLKRERNSFARFGGLIDSYPVEEGIADSVVVQLLYEGRMVEMEQNEKATGAWFERHSQGLTREQEADLKKKFRRAEMLNKADQMAYMRVLDINEHYRQSWQGTAFKAQLVAPSKAAAIKYKQFLDEIGDVTSEVVISAPDMQEGDEDIEDGPTDEVVEFWNRMMKRFGSEDEYLKQIINRFKNADTPEILIVVDKLLTGFDAPRNAVLYLTRTLREHSLLQAVARVNRIYDDEFGARQKDVGYIIDYTGVLGRLDKALTSYEALQGFEESDLRGTLRSVREEIQKLPQRHAGLWGLFKEIKNKTDEEAFERLLADEIQRSLFYERLTAFAKTLGIALSSEQFLMATPARKVQAYKNDFKRFANLRTSVKLRYAEAVDYRQFEPRIQKLLDTHISAAEVVRLNQPVNIFDDDGLKKVLEEQAGKSSGARADTIAHATKRAIRERLETDPAFYEKFSRLIQQAIDDFRARRISDLEYLKKVSQIKDSIVHRRNDDVPVAIRNDDDASALFRILKRDFARHGHNRGWTDDLCAEAAARIWAILRRNKKVGFWDDLDAQRRTVNEIDDYLYDEIKEGKSFPLTTELMDGIIEESMRLARHRIVN